MPVVQWVNLELMAMNLLGALVADLRASAYSGLLSPGLELEQKVADVRRKLIDVEVVEMGMSVGMVKVLVVAGRAVDGLEVDRVDCVGMENDAIFGIVFLALGVLLFHNSAHLVLERRDHLLDRLDLLLRLVLFGLAAREALPEIGALAQLVAGALLSEEGALTSAYVAGGALVVFLHSKCEDDQQNQCDEYLHLYYAIKPASGTKR